MNGEFKFAVVKSANADGVVVQFEDDQTPSPKKYTRLQSCNCIAGERVLMAPISGSYVVIGVVDRKKIITADSAARADTATTATTATRASSATNATNATNAANAEHADTADTADTADRLTNARTISLTGDVTASGSFSGASNLSMAATGVKAGAVKDQNSPSSRTVQFRVIAAGKLQFKSSYYNNGNWYTLEGTL